MLVDVFLGNFMFQCSFLLAIRNLLKISVQFFRYVFAFFLVGYLKQCERTDKGKVCKMAEEKVVVGGRGEDRDPLKKISTLEIVKLRT